MAKDVRRTHTQGSDNQNLDQMAKRKNQLPNFVSQEIMDVNDADRFFRLRGC